MTETDLMELAGRCEKLEGPCRETDAEITRGIMPELKLHRIGRDWFCEASVYSGPVDITGYTASIDAAMSLVPEGWNWMTGNRDLPLARAYVNNGQPHFTGMAARKNPANIWHAVVAATPAIALTAAALRARASLSRLSPPNEVKHG